MSFRPPAQSPTPTRHTLQQVLAAGVATKTNDPKTYRWNLVRQSVFDVEDLMRALAIQIVESAANEEMVVKDLCETLTSWCITQRVPCSEGVYQVACAALGVDTEAKADFVITLVVAKWGEKERTVPDPTRTPTMGVRGPIGLWQRTFLTLCRIHGADEAGILSAAWGEILQTQRLGGAQPAAWAQLALKCQNGYTGYSGDQDDLARSLEFVAQCNLGPTLEEAEGAWQAYQQMLLQLNGLFDEENYDGVVEFLQANNLTSSSMVQFAPNPMREDERVAIELDHYTVVLCHDVDGPNGEPTVNPVVAYLLADPAYYPGRLARGNPFPPVLRMASMLHELPIIETFKARLTHPLTNSAALSFEDAKGNNILTMLFLAKFSDGRDEEVADHNRGLLQLYRRKVALQAIVLTGSRTSGLLKQLSRPIIRTVYSRREPSTPLQLFQKRWSDWETSPAFLAQVPQMERATRYKEAQQLRQEFEEFLTGIAL